MASTSYGNWGNYVPYSTNPRASVHDAMSGGDLEWIDRMSTEGATERVFLAYVSDISGYLGPHGITMGGDQFTGPYPCTDIGVEVIRDAIAWADEQLAYWIECFDVEGRGENHE